MAFHSKTIRPKRSNNLAVSPAGFGLTAGRGTPTATGVDGTGTVLLTETFADANFAARGWYSIVSADRVASPAPSGLPGSLRMTWTAGQTLPSSGGMRHAFTATDRLYIKYQQSFSANWVGSGQAAHPHLVMCLSDQDGAFDGPSDNYLALYAEVNYQSGNRPQVKFQDNQYIDAANIGSNVGEARATGGANGQQGYADSWDLYADSGMSHGWYNSRNLSGAVAMPPGNTAWHTVECEVILNSVVGGIGQLDGICRYWWNGVLVWERTNLIMRTGTRSNLKFNQFLFAPYIGNGSPVTQTVYISDLTVATARTTGGTPPASAAVTGTATSGWYESEVVTGGDTMIATLTNDTWVAAGTTFDGQRQAILDGLVAATSPAAGWNVQRANIPVTAVVRTSNTVVTVTLPALPSYSAAANEILTWTLPASALVGGNAVVATPTLTITEGAPSAGGWLANKPSNFTNVLSDYPFSSVIPTGGDTPIGDGSIWNQVFNSGGTRRVVDANSPISPGYVLEHYYPVGHTHGTGVGQLYASLSTSQLDFYVCMMCKWSSNYEWNPVSNKFLIWDPGHLIIESKHYGDYLIFEPQDVTNPSYNICNIATPTIPLDQWVQIEVLLHRGTANGSIKIWMDGVLYMDISGIDTGIPSGWHEISINSTWGGTSSPTSRESWNWIDHIYLAVP